MRYERISADCHVDLYQLPPDLFTSNVSAALRDRMPYGRAPRMEVMKLPTVKSSVRR
jgi:hypothetical protein